ncbi:MAG: DUF3187 family protein [Gammaproteobacteria bacterium]|nr:DUF3187 family protein [Gammaproteobacteria bacterium]
MDMRLCKSAFVAIVIGVLITEGTHAQQSTPFRTRNLSPLVSVFGLPAWESGLVAGDKELSLISEVANHYRLGGKGVEELVLDGETWRTSLFYRSSLGDKWVVGIELPFYQNSGGFLDDIVDAWHSFFRLPDANRNLRMEDQLRYHYKDNGVTRYFLDKRSSGIGDVQVSFSRHLFGESSLVFKGTLKLPSGDPDILTGSGGTDLSFSVFQENSAILVGIPTGLYWGAGLMMIDDSDLFTDRHEDWVAFGTLGAGWPVLQNFGLKVQFDSHSKFYRSELDEMGKASIQVSVGGWWSLGERRQLNVAIGEDLIVRTSPDISINIDFSWGF